MHRTNHHRDNLAGTNAVTHLEPFRTVLIGFDSVDAARATHDSPAYQNATRFV